MSLFYNINVKIELKYHSRTEETITSISNIQKTEVLNINLFFSFDDQEVPFRDSISEMLSKIRADPKSAYDCNLCKVQCSSQDTLATHMQGKQHKRNVEKNNALSFGGGSAFR